MFRDLSPNFPNFYSKYKFNTSFYFYNFVLKPADNLNNDFKLTRFAFDVRQKFEAVPREKSSPTPADSRDIVNILLSSSSRSVL